MAKNYVDLTVMLVSHEAFRRDIRRLEGAAARKDLADPVARKRVRTGWNILKTQLAVHHEGEDRDLWPRMAKGLAGSPEQLSTLRELEQEHTLIDPLLAEVERAMADHATRPEQLGEAVAALGAALDAHLLHEERDGLPYVQEALTEKEWKAFVLDQRNSLGFKGAAEFFPWVLDEATPETVAKISSIMPAPLRLVMNSVWKPMYKAQDTWTNSGR
ncbi:hemerythrin domain-containing protein [Kitasatospora sp. NPDC094019]|uniref:hemerythrin domain-containing protein n=1 Tax=Kitasatospora sp. NPDC094019 TaxID=3364091 RepID=UPI0037F507AA